MDIHVSSKSFPQSAKLLAQIIEEKFGPQGRGRLAFAREALAKSLKFEDSHGAEAFLALEEPKIPRPPRAAAPAPFKGFASFEADEALHALRSLSTPNDEQKTFWGDRCSMLLAAGVQILHAHRADNAEPPEQWLPRLRELTTMDGLASWARRRPRDLMSSGPLDAYLASVPGYDRAAAVQNATAMEQHGYAVSMLAKTLEAARNIEARADEIMMPNEALSAFNGGFQGGRSRSEFFSSWAASEYFQALCAQASHLPMERGLDLWTLFQAALNRPLQAERETLCGLLSSLAALPRSVFKSSQDALARAGALHAAAAGQQTGN